MSTLYQTLGVSETATKKEIKSAYRNLAKKWHPDINKAKEAHARFIEINKAYEILIDDTKRTFYDRYYKYSGTGAEDRSRYEEADNNVGKWSREAEQRAQAYAGMSYADFAKIVLGVVFFSAVYFVRFLFSILLLLVFGIIEYSLLEILIVERDFSALYIIGIIIFTLLFWAMALSVFGYIVNIRRNFSDFNFDIDTGRVKFRITSIVVFLSLLAFIGLQIPEAMNSGQWDQYEDFKTIKAHDVGDVFLDFNPDGKSFVSGSGDGTVKLWEAETGRCLGTLLSGSYDVNVVKYSNDGRFIACGKEYMSVSGHMQGKYEYVMDNISSDFTTVIIWDAQTGKLVWADESGESVEAIDFSNDNKLFAVANSAQIFLYTLPDFTPYDTLGIGLMDLRRENDNRSFEEKDKEFTDYRNSRIKCMEFGNDSKFIVTGGNDVLIWDLTTGEKREFQCNQAIVNSIDISPDDKYVACGGWEESSTIVWDVNSGTQVSKHIDRGVPIFSFNPVNTVKFSPDSKMLIVGSSGRSFIRIFETATMDQKFVLRRHENDDISSVCFSKDGRYIISADDYGNIKIWKKK